MKHNYRKAKCCAYCKLLVKDCPITVLAGNRISVCDKFDDGKGKPEDIIFNKWNSLKNSKHHRSLKPDMTVAIKFHLKAGWTVEDITGAMDNYDLLLSSKDYELTYGKWSLAEFLTRGQKDNDYRWIWFEPDRFRAKDWMTDAARKREIEKNRRPVAMPVKTERVKPYANTPDDELAKIYNDGNTMVRNIVRKHRPDIDRVLESKEAKREQGRVGGGLKDETVHPLLGADNG